MMKQLQGRSMKHPGCLIGVTTGLIIGIILAGVLASAFNTPYSTLLWIWFGLTLGLGAIGWIIGDRIIVKDKPAAVAEEHAEIESAHPMTQPDLPPSQS